MKKFHLDIVTPFGKYMSKEAEFLQVQSDNFLLGILPNHAPLVSTLAISEMIIKDDGEKQRYAIGGGIIRIDNDGNVTLLLDSIESEEEIDLDRAKSSRQRALERLENKEKENAIDIKRAERSLKRAVNRIKLIEKDL